MYQSRFFEISSVCFLLYFTIDKDVRKKSYNHNNAGRSKKCIRTRSGKEINRQYNYTNQYQNGT